MLTVVPERRPSIEDLQQHPQVMKCEENIPSDTYPDPNILDILSDLGFDANAILESLQKRKCDEVVRAYLIKEQVHKGLERGCNTAVKPAVSGPTPPPSPAHPSVSGLHLKQRAREPIFGLFHTQPSQQHLPDVLRLSEHKAATGASIPLYCPQKKAPLVAVPPPYRAAAASCACSSNIGRGNAPATWARL